MAINLDNDNIQLSDKILPEDVTRRKILRHCMKVGCYQEMLQIFEKYDRLLRNCTNNKEREEMAKLGVYEAYALLDKGGKLYVNNKLLYIDEECKSNIDNNEDENKIII